MTTALTIKNIPDTLYEKLKASAAMHHRSINSELIFCLETVLMPQKLTVEERIAVARAIRPNISIDLITPVEIMDSINQGRP